jgi:hypothetical protein
VLIRFSCELFLSEGLIDLFQNQKQSQSLAATAASTVSQCWHPCSRPEVAATARSFSTMRTQQPGSLPEYQVDPYHLLEDDLKDVYVYIRDVSQHNY